MLIKKSQAIVFQDFKTIPENKREKIVYIPVDFQEPKSFIGKAICLDKTYPFHFIAMFVSIIAFAYAGAVVMHYLKLLF